jgi:acyl carrier protein
MVPKEDIPAIVRAVIGEMFSVDTARIDRATTATDIDGWDSLAHTVLMVRLERRLGMPISERIAAKASSVGELIDLLSMESATGG